MSKGEAKITLSEAIAQRQYVEGAILDILVRFHRATGLSVTDITVHNEVVFGAVAGPAPVAVTVEVKL